MSGKWVEGELELELASTRVVSKWRDELEERVTNSFGWSGKLWPAKTPSSTPTPTPPP